MANWSMATLRERLVQIGAHNAARGGTRCTSAFTVVSTDKR
jgi:hypothetical protein